MGGLSDKTKGFGLFSALTGEPMSGIAGLVSGGKDMMQLPDAPELPPEVEEVDVSGQKEYTKKKAKSRKGRKSTILTSLGTQNQNKKTVLG